MRSLKSSKLDRVYYLAVAIFTLCAAALVFYATRFNGAGVSTDSVKYIAAARNWVAGNGLYIYDGTPLVLWPPFYPIVLGILSILTGYDPIKLVYLVNPIVFALTVASGGLYFRRKLPGQPLIALMGTVSVLFSIPLFSVSTWAWSESSFNLLLLLSFILMDFYLDGRGKTPMLGLVVVAGMAAVDRYLGLTVIIWGSLLIFFWTGKIKQRILHGLSFGFGSFLPAGLWMMRNYMLTATLMGHRGVSTFTVKQLIPLFWKITSGWFFLPGGIWRIVGLTGVVLVLAGLILLIQKSGRETAGKFINSLIPSILYLIVFIGFILASTLLSQPDINSRILSPLFVPVIICITLAFAEVTQLLERHVSPGVISIALSAIFISWVILVPSPRIRGEMRDMIVNGGGLNTRASRENDVGAYLKDNQLDKKCKVYTNFVEAAYFLGGVESSSSLSRKRLSVLEAQAIIDGEPASWPPESKACLAWFNDRVNENYIKADELQKVANVRTLAELKYGVVYELTPKNR
jgi:hypothetical protein